MLQGLNIIISDADVVWMDDPRPHFRRGNMAKADILVTTDCIDHREDSRNMCLHVNFNTGISYTSITRR